jgi:hypothetical protein
MSSQAKTVCSFAAIAVLVASCLLPLWASIPLAILCIASLFYLADHP